MESRTSQIFALALALSSLFLTFSLSSAATCNAADKTALVAFKNHFPANTFPNSWNTQSDCCFWDGVTCDSKTGRVTSLLFTSDQDDPDHLPVNLVGTIPPSIGSLTALQSISLQSFPSLVGTLPAQMANLKNLQYFTIYNCSIAGPLPTFFDQWTPLIELEINRCGTLTGPIPASLGNLANLIVRLGRKAAADCPKKVASLIDLANLTSTVRDFVGQSQISRLGCFLTVWSYIKANKLQDPQNKNVVNCDDKLKSILLGKPQVELSELPMLIKLHFSKQSQ